MELITLCFPVYSRKKMGWWDKFMLLMWKNMLLVWRRKFATVIEVLVPVAFAGLLVLIRSLQMPTAYPEPHIYNSFAPTNWEWTENCELECNLAYAPAHPALIPLMERVRVSMNIEQEFIAYATVAEMNFALIEDQSRRQFAGVIFEGIDSTDVLPNDLHAVLRFPAELRNTNNPLSNNWQTDALFPLFSTGGPRNHLVDDGGRPPGYYRQHFAALQAVISQAFVEIKGQVPEDTVVRTMMISRFPEGPLTIDVLLSVMQVFLPLILFLGFIYPAINNVKVGVALYYSNP